MIECEVWRSIPSTGGRYDISNFGNIRNAVRRVYRKAQVSRDGYAGVVWADSWPDGTRRSRWLFLHIEVMRAFVGPRPRGMVVNHLDGNKLNNRLDNLEYTTSRGNAHHARNMGRLKKPVGEDSPTAKLTNEYVKEIILLKTAGVSNGVIGEMFGVTGSCVSNIVNGNRWQHITGIGMR